MELMCLITVKSVFKRLEKKMPKKALGGERVHYSHKDFHYEVQRKS